MLEATKLARKHDRMQNSLPTLGVVCFVGTVNSKFDVH